jgi:hypothetical protein
VEIRRAKENLSGILVIDWTYFNIPIKYFIGMKSTTTSVAKYSADDAVDNALIFTQYRSPHIAVFQKLSTGVHWNIKANMQAVVIRLMKPITQKMMFRKLSLGKSS